MIALKDIDASGPDREQKHYKYGSPRHAKRSFELLIRQYSLMLSTVRQSDQIGIPATGAKLAQALDNAFRSKHNSTHGSRTSDILRHGSAAFDPAHLEDIYRRGESYGLSNQLQAYGTFPTVTLIHQVEDALAAISSEIPNPVDVPSGINVEEEIAVGRKQVHGDEAGIMRDKLARGTTKPDYAESDIDDNDHELDNHELDHGANIIDSSPELSPLVPRTLERLEGYMTECRQLIADAVSAQLSKSMTVPAWNKDNITAGLAALYTMCWGPKWRINCDLLGSEGVLNVSNSLEALIGSCLMKLVWCESASWPAAVCKQANILPTECMYQAEVCIILDLN